MNPGKKTTRFFLLMALLAGPFDLLESLPVALENFHSTSSTEDAKAIALRVSLEFNRQLRSKLKNDFISAQDIASKLKQVKKEEVSTVAKKAALLGVKYYVQGSIQEKDDKFASECIIYDFSQNKKYKMRVKDTDNIKQLIRVTVAPCASMVLSLQESAAQSSSVLRLQKVQLENQSVGIVSNLAPYRLNYLIGELLKKKARISVWGTPGLEPADLYKLSLLKDAQTDSFSVESLEPPKSQKLPSAAESYFFDKVFPRPDPDAELRTTLKENNLRYVLIVYADKSREKSFARMLDLKEGRPIYMRYGFLKPSKQSGIEDDYVSFVLEDLFSESKAVIAVDKVRGGTRIDKQNKESGQEELASVAIINFYDKTKTNLYGWMSVSLADAITGSMNRVFEFKRTPPDTAQKEADKLLKNSLKPGPVSLLKFQEVTGADYLILGHYTYSKKKKKIKIKAMIYDLSTGKQIGGVTKYTPVDNRMFSVVDKIAKAIVKDIYKLATEESVPQ